MYEWHVWIATKWTAGWQAGPQLWINVNNLVAVKTPVGQTERVNIIKMVTQGGPFGPHECSKSIDKVGKKC